MRPFDWLMLLREQGVPFAERGPNVKRGEVNVRCPFCGSADPSKHMGLNLETGWWSCWRNRAQHSGKSPVRLLMALLRVPYHRAREIAGLAPGYVDPEGFDALAARLLQREGLTGRPAEVQRRRLQFDPDFHPILNRGSSRRAYEYLRDDRGFNGRSAAGDDALVVAHLYQLKAAYRGDFASRVVMPYFQDGELVTWTGRAIGDSSMRYRDLAVDESILPPKETLFNHDAMLQGGVVLVVQEGPFDALKTDFYGEPWGVRAVALSTNSVTDTQAFLLQTALGKFKRVLVGLDNKTGFGAVDSLRMKQSLSFLGDALGVAHLPDGVGDAGDLTPQQATAWAQSLAGRTRVSL